MLGAAIALGIERNKFPGRDPGGQSRRPARPGADYDIVVFETEHRADTVGFALVEHTRLGRFNPERARELGIPEGPLWGRLHQGRDHHPRRRPRRSGPRTWSARPGTGARVVYTGDTRPHLPLIEAARGADLLVHEATFGGDELERAKETGHSTAAEAARVAAEAGVRRLVLTHISPRYSRDAAELLAEARAIFPETIIARDGLTVDVPYAD